MWTVAHLRIEVVPDDYWTEDFYLGGDTVIADVKCSKMMHGTGQYAGAVCEEGTKVEFFAPGTQSKALLYDFGAQVGDVFPP